MRYFLALLFLITGLLASQGLNDIKKFKHTKQETIASLSPAPASKDVYPDTDIEVTFNVDLDEKHIHRDAIRVRKIDGGKKKRYGKKANVEGTVSYEANQKTLSFTPSKFLQPGLYEVEIKAIKSTKKYKHHNIKNITYRFSVADITPVSLKITPAPIEVKEGSTVELLTTVVYDDNSERVLNENVVYTSAESSILNIETNATATALKEGTATVTSTYKGLTSSIVDVTVYLEIGGHRLPPEPDPTINNSTLLGIDSNNNGVRDDVERWIYIFYTKPIERAVFMQRAKAYQIVIQEPDKALMNIDYMHDVVDCESYWSLRAKREGESFWLEKFREYSKEIQPVQFNTAKRFLAYEKYNHTLSGGVYVSSKPSEWKNKCDFNISTLIKVP